MAVTFETKVWQKDWDLIVKTPILGEQSIVVAYRHGNYLRENFLRRGSSECLKKRHSIMDIFS
ncbi:hypothetical protein M2128_002105 [Polynucleobacter sphagniphilus]|nr:hypothetical protein [Polynucleobacter sphagniphilus]